MIRDPQMPNEADPKYARWKAALKKEFGRLESGAILVGHSIGGTILITTLVEEPPDLTLGGIFLLAAPFVVRRLPGRDHQLDNDMSEVAADIRQLG